MVETCHMAGISKKCIKLRPIAVIKGWTVESSFHESKHVSTYVFSFNSKKTSLYIQIKLVYRYLNIYLNKINQSHI